MRWSLKGGIEDAYWIDSSSQIFIAWLIGGLFGLLGALLTLFPLIAILLSLPIFSDLRKDPSQEGIESTGSILKYGTILGIVGIITYFPSLAIGLLLQSAIHFPAYYGLAILVWMIGSGLLAAGVLAVILRRKSSQYPSFQELLGTGSERAIPTLIKTFALAAIVLVWLYGLTLLVDLGLVLDLRSFLPGLNDLTFLQATLVPIYFVGFLVYTLIDGTWLTSILLPKSSGTWMKVQIEWSATTVFVKCLPYLILIAIEFVGGLIIGAPVFPGLIGFSWLFFYAFTPWFAVCTLIAVFAYRLTGNRWLGAITNAILCAWLLATILPYYG